mmetsp:Transcript_14197/g.16462  ORF Transcript_14197/g.16462 Transcript_14197/m.16462 type:complete len:243 (+) Transcript_14197:242-970(+)
MREKTGVRAITLQQPYAAAVASGVCNYSRRGKETKFANDSEWVAIHCGSNNVHLKNQKAMAAIRITWPECPSDEELCASQKHILGFARFIGCVPANSEGPKTCPFMKEYQCSKAFCWEANAGVPLKNPISYPKGNLQIWNLYDDGFTNAKEGGATFRKLISSMTAESNFGSRSAKGKVKTESNGITVEKKSLIKKEENQNQNAGPMVKSERKTKNNVNKRNLEGSTSIRTSSLSSRNVRGKK